MYILAALNLVCLTLLDWMVLLGYRNNTDVRHAADSGVFVIIGLVVGCLCVSLITYH